MIISVEDKRFITSPPDQFLDEFSLKQYKARGLYAKDGQLTVIEVRSQRISNLSKVVSTVEALRKYDRSLVSYSVLASIKHQVMLLFSISRLGWQFDALFTKSDCQRIEKVWYKEIVVQTLALRIGGLIRNGFGSLICIFKRIGSQNPDGCNMDITGCGFYAITEHILCMVSSAKGGGWMKICEGGGKWKNSAKIQNDKKGRSRLR